MGLIHPSDMDAWRHDHEAAHPWRNRLSAVRSRLQGRDHLAMAVPAWSLARGSTKPRILIVLDSTTPTSVAAALRPAHFLSTSDIAVLSPDPLGGLLPTANWQVSTITTDGFDHELTHVEVTVSLGHHLPIGHAVQVWAARRQVPVAVVQHGLMTPLAPPLPPGAHLFAWSQEDAAFWASGRSDVRSTVVGSQLLHEVVTGPQRQVDPAATPIYLGQLHGAELPRRDLARAAYRFCRQTGATYRPHPAERDKLSRLIHAAWERRGITIDRSGSPLAQVDRPVVSVFSTGVLEAAARGVPSWVDFERPPPWLVDFWHRYGMSTWGGPPTPPPPIGADEPAALIARELLGA